MTGSFEYRAKPDTIFDLTTGETSEGWRVEYRRPGVRRWTRFLLVQETFPSKADAELMLLAHEARGAANSQASADE